MRQPLAATAILAAAVAGMTLAPGVAGQQSPPPTPTFRVHVDAVEFDATVTDARNRPVTDLTADDFEILEDGKPQTIISFALVQIPVEPAQRPRVPAISPDVRSNNRGEGRLFVIALDDVTPAQALRTRLFVHRFVEEHFGPNDLGAVFFIGRGGSTLDAQGLTSDPRRLLAAVDRFSGGFPDEPVPREPPSDLQVPQSPRAAISERDIVVRRSLTGLRNVVEFMAGVHGRRKALLVFTEGFPIDLVRVADYRGGVLSLAEEEAHKAVAAASRNSVLIYPIDPRGLLASGGSGSDQSATSAGDVFDRLDSSENALAGLQNLSALASVTGGFAVANTNRLADPFRTIAEQSSTYYVLGFTSTNDRPDGRYRRVVVRLKKRPELRVQARAGYVAPLGSERLTPQPVAPANMSAALAQALRSPVAVNGVPIRVFAAAYKGVSRDANVELAVDVDATTLGLTETNGARVGTLEVSYFAVDNRNKIYPGNTLTEKLALKPETYDRVVRSGIRTLVETHLRPGRYQIRVAAGNGAGKSGSVVYDLDVPDFNKGPLVLSGVSVGSAAAATTLTVRPPGRFATALPVTITARREFERGDSLRIYSEAYENMGRAQPHTVDFRAELRADNGRPVRWIMGQRSSADPGNENGYRFTADLPLGSAAPGAYIVHVEARSNTPDHPAVSRDIPISVR